MNISKTHQKTAFVYALILFLVATLNYIPGLTDANGLAFGIFALDVFDDSLHFFSGVWALIAALHSKRAARIFLVYFGALYLSDGLLGLATGSGYLDFGIFVYGIQDFDLVFKILANLPHILLGGIALAVGWFVRPSAG